MKSYFINILYIILITFVSGINLLAQGPAGIGNKTGTDGQPRLAIWLDASKLNLNNNDKVSEWTDFSGNNNNAIQTIEANRPTFKTNVINGNPVVDFDINSQNFLNFDGSVLAQTNYTFTFVGTRKSYKVGTGWSNKEAVVGGVNQVNLTQLVLFLEKNLKFGSSFWNYNYEKDLIKAPNTNTGGTEVGTFGIFTELLESQAIVANRRIYQNNTLLGSLNSNRQLSSFNGATLGRYHYNGFVYNDIQLSEVIAYSSDLNIAQLNILNNYLHYKYNINISSLIYEPELASFSKDLVGIGTSNGILKHSKTSISSGSLYLEEYNNSLNNSNEYLFVAHDGTAHGVTKENVPIDPTLEDRWERTWYFQKTNDSEIDVILTFDFAETNIDFPDNSIYVLLYKENESDDFAVLNYDIRGVATKAYNRVNFTVPNSYLKNGYYTIARTNFNNLTWHAYLVNGNWNDPNSWTIVADDNEYVNPNNWTPATSPTAEMDVVIIGSGKRIIVNINNIKNSILEVKDGGIVDFGSTTGHNFNEIRGKGIIRLLSDNFPNGNASTFRSSIGGTVEYYNNSNITLTTPQTFNNVLVNMTSNELKAVLMADYTLNGNLIIQRGILQINDDLHPAPVTDIRRNLIIKKDLVVQTSGQLTIGNANTNNSSLDLGNGGGPYYLNGATGLDGRVPANSFYHQIYHQVEIWGNFENSGIALFTNQDQPIYNQLSGYDGLTNGNTGAAVVTFKGATDNQVLLYGPTDFYHLIIDKGNTQDRVLSIDASDQQYFRLFGSNVLGGTGGGENPEIRKALWIKNGTLRLTGNINIPTLTQGNGGGSPNSDFYIPLNARLWVDGAKVNVTADNQVETAIGGVQGLMIPGVGKATPNEWRGGARSISFYGSFRITDGELNVKGAGGIIIWALGSPSFSIEGGIVDAPQIRSTTAANNIITYYQTGGVFNLRGNINNYGGLDANRGTFSMVGNNNAFIMQGGKIVINDGIGVGGVFEIDIASENIGVTGGTVEIIMDKNQTAGNRNNYFINSIAPIFNLSFKTKGTDIRTMEVTLFRDLNILNDLLIEDDVSFITGEQIEGPFYNVMIGRNFTLGQTINSNAKFVTQNVDKTLGSNITLYGNNNSEYKISNTTATNYELHKLTIDKKNNSNFVKLISHGRTPANATSDANTLLNIVNSINVKRGVLDYNGFSIGIFTNAYIENSGTIGLLEDSTGFLCLSNSNAQTINIPINTKPVFGRLLVSNNDKVSFIGLSDFTIGNLQMRRGIIDIASLSMIIYNDIVDDNGLGVPYGISKYIRMAGNHGDGGVVRRIFKNGDYFYPIGTLNRYAYAHQTFNNVTNEGYVQVNAVPKKLPTMYAFAGGLASRYLRYYWRIRYSGFEDGLPNLINRFLSHKDDYNWSWDHGNYVAGKIVNLSRHPNSNETDDAYGTAKLPVIGNNRLLNYGERDDGTAITPHILEKGEFTSAIKQFFQGDVKVYYSKAVSGVVTPWANNNNWSFANHEQNVRPNAGSFPGDGDIAVIGYNKSGTGGDDGIHSMLTPASLIVAEVHFVQKEGINASNLVIDRTHNINIGITFGAGTIHLRDVLPGVYPIVTSDFSDFMKGDKSMFYFTLNADGLYNLPKYSAIFPSLRIDAKNIVGIGNRIAYFSNDVVINKNLFVDNGARFEVRSNTKIYGNLYLGNNNSAGRLQFQETVGRTIDLGGIFMSNNPNNIIQTSGSNSIKHSIIVNGGSIIKHNGSINLFTNNTTGNNTILEFNGENNSEFSVFGGNIPSLYNIRTNKSRIEDTVAINTNFTLGAPINIGTHSLNLVTGTLILNNPDININLVSGGADFPIPNSSALILSSGRINATSNGFGIFLNGLLRLENNAEAHFYDWDNESDTYIYYSSIGTAKLEVADNAKLYVGSQIRGNTAGSNALGILRYSQTGGDVIVGRNFVPINNRGVFEVFNMWSTFNFSGGRLTIARNQLSEMRSALFLDPSSYNVSDTAEIIIGGDYTPNLHTVTINSNIPLENITIKGSSTTMLVKVNNLTVNNFLNVTTNNRIDLNGMKLTINGDFYNEGASPNINASLTTFSGNIQELRGETTFNELVVSPNTSLQIGNNIMVNGLLTVSSGNLIDNENTITLKGNIINNANIVSISNLHGGLLFNGNVLQNISGTGSFCRIEINNSHGVRLLNSLDMNTNIKLTNGILDIQNYRLSLCPNCMVEGEFNMAKMITTKGTIESHGIIKNFDIGNSNFLFPIGVPGKYTPVEINCTNDNPSSLTVKPLDQQNITTLGYGDDNVLQYQWYLESVDMDNFSGQLVFNYDTLDIVGDPTQYIPARLIDINWVKLAIEDFKQDSGKFIFSHFFSDNISGYYTAGYAVDIPDQVQTFRTISNGEWTNPNIWVAIDGGSVPSNGPFGHIVEIMPEHTVNIPVNGIRTYMTHINGTLTIGNTFQHNLGVVDGQGKISINTSMIPAGNFDSFFNTTGSTIEYVGTGHLTISDRFLNLQNVIIRGVGEVLFPNENVTVNGNLTIKDGVTFKQQNDIKIHKNIIIQDGSTLRTEHNKIINFYGDTIILTDDSKFDAELTSIINFYGANHKHIIGNVTGNGNRFNNFYLHNNQRLNIHNDVEVRSYLSLNDSSRIIVYEGATFSLALTNALQNISSMSYVQGNLRRNLHAGSNHLFPVGRNNKRRDLALHNVEHNQYWVVRYYDQNPSLYGFNINSIKPDEDLEEISDREFWKVIGPAGGKARVQLSWGEESHIPENVLKLRVAQWEIDAWESRGGSIVNINGLTGKIDATIVSNFSEKYFTLSSSEFENPLPIQLLTFDAFALENKVKINWTTANETNNNYFTIEKSINNIDFNPIANVKTKAPNGYSNEFLFYEIYDNNPTHGLSYYRLKQTDFDGNYNYSNIIPINFVKRNNLSLSIFPNPIQDKQLNVSINGISKNSIVSIRIVDIIGQNVYTEILRAEDKQIIKKIDIATKIKSGPYFIIINTDTTILSSKFIIN